MTTKQHPVGPLVRRFLLEEIVADRNLSINTQCSYRDAIRLLFAYINERHGTDPTRITVEQITVEVTRAFLAHLENRRGNSVATRNQRLAAIRSLFRYIGRQIPELIEHASLIRGIPPRRTSAPTASYLEKHEIDALLGEPDQNRFQGRRDYAILLFLYNTGARASEVHAVTTEDLDLGPTPSVRLLGKGRKIRPCPLWAHTADVLRDLLRERGEEGKSDAPVFLNVRGQPITRYRIHDLVTRTVRRAQAMTPSLKDKRVSPHTIRHTTAVHLLRAAVDINTIRAWLGHVSLETTNRYAQIDLKMKAAALDACAICGDDREMGARTPLWHQNSEFMAFLMTL